MTVDRRGLAEAYSVRVRDVVPGAPLSAGNGSLCFTVDVTGLQTWPGRYPLTDPAGGDAGTLLATLSDWGWHCLPQAGGYDVSRCARPYQTRRGPVRYADLPAAPDALAAGNLTAQEAWLRGNPHRLDLLRMGFVTSGPGRNWRPPPARAAGAFDQCLDLWSGVITSSFRLHGVPVTVRTCCHPALDVIAVRVSSGLLASGRLAVRLAFPYGSQRWGNAADWTRPGAHATDVSLTPGGCLISRSLDGKAAYTVAVALAPVGAGVTVTAPHELVLSPAEGTLEITVRLSPAAAGDSAPAPAVVPSCQQVSDAARHWWARFWSRGAAVDVTGSADRRAGELQRRIMLSSYLTAVNCAGSVPPQETGLLANSWSGKFHLEMHWWHCAHFAIWGRPDLLERSLAWYERALPAARRIAAEQGYAGARWPKTCGPEGSQTPSPIAPFLIWQQPHPIYLAELARLAGTPDVTLRYARVVLETAAFMASFADRTPRGYELGPPLVPAQESYAPDRARLANPTFELAYWSWALGVAARWRERLGLAAEPAWDAVAVGLVRPPVRDGIYAAVARDGEPLLSRDDHPSMLYAYGMVPPTPAIDPAVMRATLRSVLADWDWASSWGWDFPALAMTAARLGAAGYPGPPGEAVGILLMDVPKNQYLLNGHNSQGPSLPAYLPGNGALLTAVALMARIRAFPAGWRIEHEGLRCPV
jgi:hypothetical protein